MTDSPPSETGPPNSGPRRRIPTAGLLIGGFLVVLAVVFVIGQAFVDDAPAGDPAPDVVIPILAADGESTATLSLADLRGKPVVVNFFAAWCAPCVHEMPEFQQVHEELGDAVTFVGVDVNDRASDALRLIDETGITYVVGIDQTGEIHREFNEFQVMPTTAFITADGSLAEVHPGILSGEDLRSTIDRQLLTDRSTEQ